MTTPLSVQALRELLAKATPGPWAWRKEEAEPEAGEEWRVTIMSMGEEYALSIVEGAYFVIERGSENETNANLIVEAVNALPALLDEVERLRELLDRMRSRVETAEPPFGKGMQIQVLISAFDLIEARDPHALIDVTIQKAQHDLHAEWDRLRKQVGEMTDPRALAERHVPLHVYPTSERLHELDGYPERLCWCPYRVEIVNDTPLVIHERMEN